MCQVLFFIPLKALADSLPDIDLLIPALVLFLGIVAPRLLDREKFGKKYYVLVGVGVGLLAFPGIIKWLAGIAPARVPIYGYGTMLFVAFIACTWFAGRLALREGIAPVHVQDLAIWMFLMGIVGARLTYMIFAEPDQFHWNSWIIIGEFFRVWDGGLVFYGSALGGLAGYWLGYRFVLKRYGVSTGKMADVIAPCIALGLALGRVGCLLNGCCYGNVATCPYCPGLAFPLSSPSRFKMTELGHQTAAGFTIKSELLKDLRTESRKVAAVEPDSPAALAGLKVDDVITHVNGQRVGYFEELDREMIKDWHTNRRGENLLRLKVQRAGDDQEVQKEVVFRPLTLGLHPTQIYESISMLLVFFLLLAYYPFRRQPGSVMVLFMLCYGVHRFLNEMLRTDTDPVALNMTLSQNISVLVLAAGVVLGLYLRIKTLRERAQPPPLPLPSLPSENIQAAKDTIRAALPPTTEGIQERRPS